MTTLEIWLLAVSLAIDCFTVSVTSGIILRRIQWRTFLKMAFFFGFFQALMPLIGWGKPFQTSHRSIRPLDRLCITGFSRYPHDTRTF